MAISITHRQDDLKRQPQKSGLEEALGSPSLNCCLFPPLKRVVMICNFTKSLFIQIPIVLAIAIGAASSAPAGVVFNEVSDGDASSTEGSPTSVILAAGENSLLGNTGSGDRDYFTFTVGPTQAVESFIISEFSGSGGHFFGIAEGAAFPLSGPFLLADLITSSEAPFQVLGVASGNFGGTGVPSVLGPGSYSLLFNETSGTAVSYQADIVVTAVPEPSFLAAACLVSSGLALRRRRSKA